MGSLEEEIEAFRDRHVRSEGHYLDYMGAGLACDEQLRSAMAQIPALANPHSNHVAGSLTREVMSAARWAVLRHFEATENYNVIFTSGCTGALKLVGECFSGWRAAPPECASKRFVCHQLAHNSLLGIREIVVERGGDFRLAATIEGLLEDASTSTVSAADGPPSILVGFPMECNFSGWRAPWRAWAERLASLGNVAVLVDGAAAAPHTAISLDGSDVDFFTCSFYKMFGFPTGIGALLVRKGTPLLSKGYFGGGTVEFVSPAASARHRLRGEMAARFEDGTPNFQAIAALAAGFAALGQFGESMADLDARLATICASAVRQLRELRHGNGAPVVEVLGHAGTNYGPTVAFCVRDARGGFIGHSLVERLAAASGIQLRCGCFCNPGACQQYLRLTDGDLAAFAEAGHVCWDDQDIVDGKPTGAVRASFGLYSTSSDVAALVGFIRANFAEMDTAGLQLAPMVGVPSGGGGGSGGRSVARCVSRLSVYPVKGCGGFCPLEWPVGPSGFLFDREWMIVDARDWSPITPKRHQALLAIVVSMSLEHNALILRCPQLATAALILALDSSRDVDVAAASDGQANGERSQLHPTATPFFVVTTISARGNSLPEQLLIRTKKVRDFGVYDDAASRWLTDALGGHPVRLVRVKNGASPDTFANSGAMLVVSEASHRRVLERIRGRGRGGDGALPTIEAYRANIVVTAGTGDDLFVENSWAAVSLRLITGAAASLVSAGACHRCQQVGARDGGIHAEPLASIAALCREYPSAFNMNGAAVLGELFDVCALESAAESSRTSDGDACIAGYFPSPAPAESALNSNMKGSRMVACAATAGVVAVICAALAATAEARSPGARSPHRKLLPVAVTLAALGAATLSQRSHPASSSSSSSSSSSMLRSPTSSWMERYPSLPILRVGASVTVALKSVDSAPSQASACRR